MSEFPWFQSEILKYLKGRAALSKKFLATAAKSYGELGFLENEKRVEQVKDRLVEVTEILGIGELSTILKHQRSSRPIIRMNVAIGLYFLAVVDDDYGAAVEPIEKAIFGGSKKNPDTFKSELGFEPPAKLKSREAPQEAGRLPASYPVNIKLDDTYQRGREEFQQAKTALLSEVNEPIALTAAIHGAGGYGKTALAEEICLNEDIRKAFPGGIYWLQFGMIESNANHDKREFTRVGDAINEMLHSQFEHKSIEKLFIENKEALFKALPSEPLLLIADDIWNLTQNNSVSELPKHVSALVTTRSKSIADSSGKEVQIRRLTPEASFTLLTDGMTDLSTDQRAKLRKVSDGFMGWPLLLKMANAKFKQQNYTTLNGLIEDFQVFLDGDDILGWDIEGADGGGAQDKRRKLVGYCIEAGLAAMFNESERTILPTLGVFPDHTEIPFSVVVDLWVERTRNEVGQTRISPQRARTFLDKFNSYSFFRHFDCKTKTFRLHDEILSYFRQSHSPRGLKNLHRQLLNSMKRQCCKKWYTLPKDHIYGWKYLLFHLEKAGRLNAANKLRTNFHWLDAKLNAVGIAELDKSFLSSDLDVSSRTLRNAIRSSSRVLQARPTALAHQLFGRLGFETSRRIKKIVETAKADENFWPMPELPHLHNSSVVPKLFEFRSALVNTQTFNFDGSRVVSSLADCTALIWEANSGVALAPPLTGHTGELLDASFSFSGDKIVTGSTDCTARIWDAQTGSVLTQPLIGHEGWIRCAVFNPDGSKVVTASRDSTLRLWDVHSGTSLMSPLIGHEGEIISVTFSSNGEKIASASCDGTVRIWDVQTGAVLAQLPAGHGSKVTCVKFNPKGDQVITGSEDGRVEIWDSNSGIQLISPLTGLGDQVLSVGFNPCGDMVIAAFLNRTIRIWDINDVRLKSVIDFDWAISSFTWANEGIWVLLRTHRVYSFKGTVGR